MRIFLIFLMILGSISVYGQTITLRVLGQYTYVDSMEKYVAVIILQENPDRCDPVLGFITIEEQLKHLNESIKVIGSKAIPVPVEDFTYSEYRKKTYRIEEADADKFDEILNICKIRQITIQNSYFKLPKHRFEEEDEKAIGALRMAKLKAGIIADHLDYKVKRVVNVDDETTYASEVFNLLNVDSEKMEEFTYLMDLLSSRDSYSSESKTPERKGQYNLWVTFELIPN